MSTHSPRSIPDHCLDIAAAVEVWPSKPSDGQILNALSELDQLTVRIGRLMVNSEKPVNLTASARALYTIALTFSRHPPDEESALAAVRVATHTLASANAIYSRELAARYRRNTSHEPIA